MSIVDTRELFEKVKREAGAEGAEQYFLSFPPFTMDPKKGLFITVERKHGTEALWLSAPFEILGRVRDPQSHGWARLLRWKDDDGVIHQHPVSDQDLHGDGSALCASLANGGLKIATGGIRQHFVSYLNGAIVKARVTIVPRTGWHEVSGRKVFVLPDRADSKIIISGATTVSPYAANGILSDWQNSRFFHSRSAAEFFPLPDALFWWMPSMSP